MSKLRELTDTEYIENGQIYCKKCNKPKSFEWEGKFIYYRCECELAEKERLEQEPREKEYNRLTLIATKNHIASLKTLSNMGDKYRNVSFETSEHIEEHKKCIKYCNNAVENYKQGNGLYLYGLYGRGKTHTLACILNNLSEQLFTPFFTTFNAVFTEIKSTYSFDNKRTEEDIYKFYTKDVEFLFIDDLGTEYISERDNGIKKVIFNIINDRLNNTMPIIFSSNLSIKQLVPAGIDERVMWRIKESCKGNVIPFNGKNFRA